MSPKELGALERRFFEEWNKATPATAAAMGKLVASDLVLHAGDGSEILGLKGCMKDHDGVFTAFPDARLTIDDLVVEGDKAAIRYTLTATHKGEFQGVKPSNRKVVGWGIQIHRFASGKIAEMWNRIDTLDLMKQLGAVPAPKQGSGFPS